MSHSPLLGKVFKLAKKATCYVVIWQKCHVWVRTPPFPLFPDGDKTPLFVVISTKLNVSVTLVLSRFVVHKATTDVNNPFVSTLVR